MIVAGMHIISATYTLAAVERFYALADYPGQLADCCRSQHCFATQQPSQRRCPVQDAVCQQSYAQFGVAALCWPVASWLQSAEAKATCAKEETVQEEAEVHRS